MTILEQLLNKTVLVSQLRCLNLLYNCFLGLLSRPKSPLNLLTNRWTPKSSKLLTKWKNVTHTTACLMSQLDSAKKIKWYRTQEDVGVTFKLGAFAHNTLPWHLLSDSLAPATGNFRFLHILKEKGGKH